MIFLLVLGFPAPVPAAAHGGGTPQLTRVPAGPYLVYAWTSPEPWRVGQAHTTVAVTVLNDAGETPVTGAQVVVIFEPTDGSDRTDRADQPITAQAIEGKGANVGFYEADAGLPTAGAWRVTVQVAGTAGNGQASFDSQVQPATASRNWLLLGLGAALLLAAVAFAIMQTRKSRRMTGQQPPAAAQRSLQ